MNFEPNFTTPAISPFKTEQSRSINRLFCAAAISRSFCQLLLSDPATALVNGFQGEHFDLNSEEKCRLLTIRATSLADLASQWLHKGIPIEIKHHVLVSHSSLQ
ncbi:MAG TPA: hypothetical protein VN376_08945 [Longilinea sp.]|nr:hypothetical protein [Longilinea sp.]